MTLPNQSELQALLDYDPLTGILTWKPRLPSMFSSEAMCDGWNKRYAGKQALTAKSDGYFIGAINGQMVKAHRVIWKLVYGSEIPFIDHEDHNRSNNRLTNLREATRIQNQQNCRKKSTNKSGTTGVWWNESKQGWDAFIGLNGRKKNLGRFKTEQEAIQARADAEILYDYHPSHGK